MVIIYAIPVTPTDSYANCNLSGAFRGIDSRNHPIYYTFALYMEPIRCGALLYMDTNILQHSY